MPTFGKETIGASVDFFGVERKRAQKYEGIPPCSISKLSLYAVAKSGITGTQNLKGFVYTDSGGSPSALLGTTNVVAFTTAFATGWYDLPFASPVTISTTGIYWIGVMSGGTEKLVEFRFDSVAGNRKYNVEAFASGPSNPFGAIAGEDAEQTSLYATYSTPGGGATAVNPIGEQITEKGKAVSLQVVAQNATKYEAAGLPAGLSISPTTGLITGTPTAGAPEEKTVKITVKAK